MFILCGCVAFTQPAASDSIFLPRIVVNLSRFEVLFFVVVVCAAAADA